MKKVNKILVYLGHPAHYHLFRNVMNRLRNDGKEIVILIKSKDILEELLKRNNEEYLNILPEGRKDSKIGILIGLLKRDMRLFKFVLGKKFDLLIGSEPSIAHVGRLLNIPSLVFVEDDAEVIPHFAKLAFPFTKYVLAPVSCDLGKWENKKISYHGYQKLTYLHPNWFSPDKSIFTKYFPEEEKIFMLRLSKLNAHHDFGIGGMTKEFLLKLVAILEKEGRVVISDEGNILPELEKYQLKINPLDIHHILANSYMLISDSQSMTMEAAMLGIPSIRISDFTGRIGVLEELEYKYDLTYGIKPAESDRVFDLLEKMLPDKTLREKFKNRHSRLMNEKIDVAEFLVWLIEGYPETAEKIIGENDYQWRFK